MTQAAIYDLDDTMVNSFPLHEQAWEALFREYEIDFHQYPDEKKSHFVGMRIIDILGELKTYFDLKEDIEVLHDKRQEIFIGLVREHLEAMPGLLHSLDVCKGLDMKLSVASSGTREYIEVVLKKFAIENYFDVIVTGDDVTKGKPDPEVFITTCQELGLQPSECVVIEDATAGIAAAKGAGCRCIAVKNPYTPAQDLSQADVELNSLEEVRAEVFG